jgi:hypothetical protein
MSNLKEEYKISPHNLQFSEYLNKTHLTLCMNYKATRSFLITKKAKNLCFIFGHVW